MNSKSTNFLTRSIGRNLQFIDPLVGSNKKHYWASGEGNLGFLTTQQIQILKIMKQRERDMNALNHLRPNYENVEKCSSPVAVQFASKEKIHNQFTKKEKNIEIETSKEKKCQKTIKRQHKRFFSNSKRSLKSSNDHHSTSSKQNISKQPKKKLLKTVQQEIIENHTNNAFAKPINPRRIKTLEIEKIYNPESEMDGKIYTQRQVIQNFRRKVKSRIDIQLNSINIQVRPEFHSQKKKKDSNIETKINKIKKQSKDFNIQKSEINLKLQPKIKEATQVDVQIEPQSQALYRGKKFLSTKVYTRKKFRRDHSPTFCNSFGYPLSCYRYVQ